MFKKEDLKNQTRCRVTFIYPNTNHAKRVSLVGEFNHWDTKASPLKHKKDGAFEVTLELEKGQDYQFRYLTDQGEWCNDEAADAYVPNPFGGDNSVVST